MSAPEGRASPDGRRTRAEILLAFGTAGVILYGVVFLTSQFLLVVGGAVANACLLVGLLAAATWILTWTRG